MVNEREPLIYRWIACGWAGDLEGDEYQKNCSKLYKIVVLALGGVFFCWATDARVVLVASSQLKTRAP